MKAAGINNRILLINIYSTVNIYLLNFFNTAKVLTNYMRINSMPQNISEYIKLHFSFQISRCFPMPKIKIHLKLQLFKKNVSKIIKTAKKAKCI